MVLVTYAPEAKALYVKLNDSRIVKTISVGEGKNLDVAESGKTVGLEVIFPSSMPQEAINAIVASREQITVIS
jgi:uncharacterized protein YuzE